MEQSLGEMMVRAGVVTREECDRAAAARRRNGASLVAALVQDGDADEGRVMAFVAERFGLEEVRLSPPDVDEDAVGLLPLPLLRKRCLLPFARSGATLEVAVSDPTDLAAVDEIRFMTGRDVRTVLARPSAIRRILDHRSGLPGDGEAPRDEAAESRPATPPPRAAGGCAGGGAGGFADEGCGGPGRQRYPHRAV